MSYTNHTPNYNLPQYVGTDKPTFLGDFNNAMETIDTALHNNAENAGEGLAQLQQAQNQLTETQNAQSDLNEEVSNIGGIASTVNQNVQQALTAANDATTAANSATSQIEPAVTAANNASAAAAEAKTVADQNTTSVNELNARVTALEESAVTEITGGISANYTAADLAAASDNLGTYTINAPDGSKISSLKFNFTSFNSVTGAGCTVTVTPDDGSTVTWSLGSYPEINQDIPIPLGLNTTSVEIKISTKLGGTLKMDGTYTAEFEKV